MNESDSRYPYTYAADYLRMGVTDYDPERGLLLPTISRAQASLARKVIARALGMSDDELARKLADQYITENQETA